MEGEKERARREKGGEEKKAMVSLLVFIIATLAEKNCTTQKVHLAITLSKIRLECCSRRKERTHDEIRLLTVRLFS